MLNYDCRDRVNDDKRAQPSQDIFGEDNILANIGYHNIEFLRNLRSPT